MQLDSREQQQVLLELVNAAAFPGHVAHKVVKLLSDLEAATVSDGCQAPPAGGKVEDGAVGNQPSTTGTRAAGGEGTARSTGTESAATIQQEK